MGNRHHNKQLRAAVRAAMARTGESYQSALTRLRGERQTPLSTGAVDLLPVDYFGLPVTLATFEILGELSCVVTAAGYLPARVPPTPLFALARQRAVS